ncbi:MAG: tRNA 2-selenouridine(34) synthase MnmH [Desulfotalea sp.]
MQANAPKSPKDVLKNASKTINCELALQGDFLIVDVRTQEEFIENALPNSINIPIFDKMERSIIGTMYKQIGKNVAIDKGFDLVSERLGEIIQSFEPYRDQSLVIYCARGGMRSRAMVNFLASSGFNVAQLEGGYKAYRHLVLNSVDNYSPDLIVLHGLTGVGKTRLIEKLSPAIDLEGMARHRSSLFGALDRIPNNQKCFEAEFHQKILENQEQPIFVEGESRKIGGVFMPSTFAATMKKAKMVFIHAPMEVRIKRIIEDYPMDDPSIRQKAEVIIKSLRQRLGSDLVDHLCQLLKKDDLSDFVQILLTEYYDKRYGNCMQDYAYQLEISSENITQAVAKLQEYRFSLLSLDK